MNKKSNRSESKKKGTKKGMFIFICILVFIISFVLGIVSKTIKPKELTDISTVEWTDNMGTIYTDISYGEKEANKFDLYVPKDSSKANYGLVVYLHAGGFTTGDKSGDSEMLKWLCSKGYVACGINYTLRDNNHPEASVLSQSNEIKEAIPVIIEEAKKKGYNIDKMAMAGGSAGGCLALLYAYRDCDDAPVPVKMVFEGVGPSSFYPEDWKNYGFDKDTEEARKGAAWLFGIMAEQEITPEMIGTPEYDEKVKDISAFMWVNENTVPTLMAYGKHDKVQPFDGAVRLDRKLTEYNVPHDFIVFEHSGHGLQNDDKKMIEYTKKINEYLSKYMTIE